MLESKVVSPFILKNVRLSVYKIKKLILFTIGVSIILRIIKMKKITLSLLLVSSLSYATNIEINISNIKPIVGKLSIALDTKDTYNKDDKSNSVFSARKNISTSKHKIIISDVDAGTYALSIFHDVDNDNKLSTNLLGMPNEGYGFSNNVVGNFGKPTFKEASFIVNGEQETIKLNVVLIR
ncbi:hypothetical protein BSPWISOXPB_9633 [uncultured Gammaproteobacteria bacterium]|nr:hypothetical protein BSPWISOXPB_9633 [uncultured Gammaproteobacteria bacterium]